MTGEIALGGVFVPPLLIWLCLALVPFWLLRRLLQIAGAYRFVWHRSLFEIALYTALVGGLQALSGFIS